MADIQNVWDLGLPIQSDEHNGEETYWDLGLPLAFTSLLDPITGSSGITSEEAFGADALVTTAAGGQTITGEDGDGIASEEAFGTDGVVAGPVTGDTGITSEEAFGTDGFVILVIVIEGAAGIPSEEAFGDGQVDLHVAGVNGITSEEAFGVGLVAALVLGDAGITSEEAFGSDGIVTGPVTGTVGITSAEAFGTDGLVEQPISGASGIPSGETFGSGGVVTGPVTGATGIVSGETFGSGGFLKYDQTVTGASGITSAETFGVGLVAALISGVSGIPSEEAFGADGSILWEVAGDRGIESQESFGLSGYVLGPPDSDSYFRTYVDGELLANVKANSINVTRQLNFAATGGMVVYDGPGTYIPEVGESIEIFYYNRADSNWHKFFAGSIDTCELTKPDQLTSTAGLRFWALSCVDYGKALSRRIVNRKYPAASYGTINSILQDLSDRYLLPEGIHVVLGTDPGVAVADLEFSGTKLNEVLDQLGEMCDLDWQVDWDRNFRLGANPQGIETAPFDIDDLSENGSNFNVVKSRGLYRNKQYIKSTLSTAPPLITVRYTFFFVDHPALGAPYYKFADAIGIIDYEYTNVWDKLVAVSWNNVPVVVTNEPEWRSLGPLDFMVGADRPTGDYPMNARFNINQYFAGEHDFPQSGDFWDVTFSVLTTSPNMLFVTNDSEVTNRRLIEGGTGLYEDVFEVSGISDTDLLTELANNLLSRFSEMGLEVDYTTFDFGLECGQQQLVDLVEFDVLNRSLTIESISSVEVDKTVLQHRVKVSNATQQRDAMTAFKRLIKRLQKKNQEINWQIIMSLAETVHPLTNPGLATGTNVAQELVLIRPFTIQEIQVHFKTPPTGASIKLDILCNGVSILEDPIEYTVAGGAQTSRNFVNAPRTFAKTDKLTINVLQVGSTTPGKDGTITFLGAAGQ